MAAPPRRSRPLLLAPIALGALLALLLLPGGDAGTAEAPEVQDSTGDTAGALDLVAAWVSTDDANVTFHVRLAQLPQPPAPTQQCGDTGCAAAAVALRWDFAAIAPNGSAAPALEHYNGSFLVYRHGPADEGLRTVVGYLGAEGAATLVGNASAAVNGTEVAVTLPRGHAVLGIPEGATPGAYRITRLVASSAPHACTPAAGDMAAACQALPSLRAGTGGATASATWDRAPDVGAGLDFVFASPPPVPTVTVTQTLTQTVSTTLTATEHPPAPDAETRTVTEQPSTLFHATRGAPLPGAVAGLALLGAVILVRRRL